MVAAVALMLMSLTTFSSHVSAQTATATASATGTAGGAVSPAKTGTGGLLNSDGGSGWLVPTAMAAGAGLLAAGGWAAAGKRRSRQN